MTATSRNAPLGASAWETELYEHLMHHVEQERGLLEEYREQAAGTESRAFAYLVDLLVEDELRHHRLFAELAASLKSEAEFRDDAVIPPMDFEKADHVAIRKATNRLLAAEKDDKRELDRLRKELRDVENTTLWAVLVDLMRRDTDKHIALLQFVKHALRHA